jgi:hypothetical protein
VAASTVVSGVLHTAALAICGLWLIPLHNDPRDIAVETVWSEVAQPDLHEVAQFPINSSRDEPVDADAIRTELGHTLSETVGSVAPVLEEWAPLDALDAEFSDVSALADAVSLAGSGLDSQGLGASEGGSAFFGGKVAGKRIVYVVDASQSMNHPHPGPMVTRFGRVKLELIRSISGLAPEQQFFIVYFNDQALPMPSQSMARATPAAREQFLTWAAQVRASGRTDPEQALALALQLRPDVVYFLTDGKFPAGIVKQVTQANRNRVMIHTIGFADDEGEELLQEIADRNWGEYKFIPETEQGIGKSE